MAHNTTSNSAPDLKEESLESRQLQYELRGDGYNTETHGQANPVNLRRFMTLRPAQDFP